jgi:hypothetical protein
MQAQQEIRLGGTRLDKHRHICAFFHSRDDEYDLLLPFIKEGLEHGDKAFHIVDPDLRHDHVHRLETCGIDADQLESSKQLEIREWEHAYLRSDGAFNQDDMLNLIQEVLRNGSAEGFPLTRLVAHMEWSLQDRPGVDDLVEYESRLNEVLPLFDDPVICVYDLSKFSASTALDILRTHPMVIIGGILQENPFYMPPDQFIQELKARKANASA